MKQSKNKLTRLQVTLNGYEKALRGAAGVLAGPIVIVCCGTDYIVLKQENSIVMGIIKCDYNNLRIVM